MAPPSTSPSRISPGVGHDRSVAAVVVFLVWIYLSAIILLYGVEVTAAYARLRKHTPSSQPAAPPLEG